MLIFGGVVVPGVSWVEIVKVYNKDGSDLSLDNWRLKLFGRITACWIAGGLQSRGAFFFGKLVKENGKIVVLDPYARRWCSTTTAQPVEIELGIFDFETNTSVYRFRLLTKEEEAEAMAAWSGAHEDMIVEVARRDGSDGTLPAS